MSINWPPLDTHAHIDVNIDAVTLLNLRAVIFAANRSLDESRHALARQSDDLLTVWGIGVHPGVNAALVAYDPDVFSALLSETAYIGEIGLDARVKSRLPLQREVFSSELSQLQKNPRLTSIHSYGATAEVLDELTHTPINGVILHWWLGNRDATQRALDLGAYFSVNASCVRRSEALDHIPLDRLLLETDHPDGNRYAVQPRQPGNVADVEKTLAEQHGMTSAALRLVVWQNLASLAATTQTHDLLPQRVRAILEAARAEPRP
jgi:TatD DNase family protein